LHAQIYNKIYKFNSLYICVGFDKFDKKQSGKAKGGGQHSPWAIVDTYINQ